MQAINASSQAIGQGAGLRWIPTPRHLVLVCIPGAEAQIDTRAEGFEHHKGGRTVNTVVAPQTVSEGGGTRLPRSVVATVIALLE